MLDSLQMARQKRMVSQLEFKVIENKESIPKMNLVFLAKQPTRKIKGKYQDSSSSSISLLHQNVNGTFFEPSFLLDSKSRK